MPTTEAEIQALRSLTRGVYATQKLRIQMGLRLCANFRSKLKVDPNEKLDDEDSSETGELSEKAKTIIETLKAEYGRLTDGIAKNRDLPAKEGFKGLDLIGNYTELVLVDSYVKMEKQEKAQFRYIGVVLKDYGIFNAWLDNQVGIGPAMAAVLLTRFNIHKAIYPSQFWAIAGLDVGPDGRARCRRKEHLIEREYVAKDGTVKTKMSTTFDTWLQARLLGAMGASLMRAGSPYRRQYDDYKHRINTDPNRVKGDLKDKKAAIEAGGTGEEIWHKMRIHRASNRYMVKQFIADFWRKWREHEGLPVVPTYHEAKQSGHLSAQKLRRA